MYKVVGPNLYRVLYRIKHVDKEFQSLVFAHSEKEAMSYFSDVVKVTLVESDVSAVVPQNYVSM